jgi:AcrR family transcriptional regulator
MTTTARRPRGEYGKSRARRKEIVDAAVEVFATVGYHKGSLRDVADRVGMSQAGLLHHFPSKEHLLQAVLTWRDDDARALMGGESLPTGIDLLRALVELAQYNAGHPQLVELHVILSGEGASAEHPLHEYFVDRYERVYTEIRDAFEAAAERGQLQGEVDSASAAKTVIALMDGLQLQWLLHREEVDMAADLRRYLQLLVVEEI